MERMRSHGELQRRPGSPAPAPRGGAVVKTPRCLQGHRPTRPELLRLFVWAPRARSGWCTVQAHLVFVPSLPLMFVQCLAGPTITSPGSHCGRVSVNPAENQAVGPQSGHLTCTTPHSAAPEKHQLKLGILRDITRRGGSGGLAFRCLSLHSGSTSYNDKDFLEHTVPAIADSGAGSLFTALFISRGSRSTGVTEIHLLLA